MWKNFFFLGIKHSTSVLLQTYKTNIFLLNFAANFLISWLFSFLAQKTLKIKISASVWSAPKHWSKYTTGLQHYNSSLGYPWHRPVMQKYQFILSILLHFPFDKYDSSSHWNYLFLAKICFPNEEEFGYIGSQLKRISSKK